MKRPRLDRYSINGYTEDLETYCDDLEDENKNLRKAVGILMRQIDLYTKNCPLESYTHEEWLNKLMNMEIDENE